MHDEDTPCCVLSLGTTIECASAHVNSLQALMMAISIRPAHLRTCSLLPLRANASETRLWLSKPACSSPTSMLFCTLPLMENPYCIMRFSLEQAPYEMFSMLPLGVVGSCSTNMPSCTPLAAHGQRGSDACLCCRALQALQMQDKEVKALACMPARCDDGAASFASTGTASFLHVGRCTCFMRDMETAPWIQTSDLGWLDVYGSACPAQAPSRWPVPSHRPCQS